MKKASTRYITSLNPIALIVLLVSVAIPLGTYSGQCCVCATPCKTSTFCNTDGIVLLGTAITAEQGIPSPSCINVCGLPKWSVVKGLTVKLENVQYPQSNLVSVVLLSPCGDAILLLNSVGGPDASFGENNQGVTFCFSDCDGTSLSCTDNSPFIGTIKARPTDCTPGDNCVTGISNSSFGTKLSATFCKPACGCWKLFTCTKASGSSTPLQDGSIESWKLIIDHCIPCEKPCAKCNVCDSCQGCPKTSSSLSSCTSSCNSCSSSCSSCH